MNIFTTISIFSAVMAGAYTNHTVCPVAMQQTYVEMPDEPYYPTPQREDATWYIVQANEENIENTLIYHDDATHFEKILKNVVGLTDDQFDEKIRSIFQIFKEHYSIDITHEEPSNILASGGISFLNGTASVLPYSEHGAQSPLQMISKASREDMRYYNQKPTSFARLHIYFHKDYTNNQPETIKAGTEIAFGYIIAPGCNVFLSYHSKYKAPLAANVYMAGEYPADMLDSNLNAVKSGTATFIALMPEENSLNGYMIFKF